MRKYWFVFSNALQSMNEYRLSLALDILGNLISSLVLYLFWYFLVQSGMNIGNYTATSLGLYFLTVATIAATVGFDSHAVAEEIKDGNITQYLLKPFSYMWLKFSTTFPHGILKLIVGILVLVLLAMFGFPVNINPILVIFFVFSLFLAMIGNYLIYFTTGLGSFWTVQTFGLSAFVSIASSLVSGRLIPIDLLPSQITMISSWLPFRHFVFFPAQIFLGHLSFSEILAGLSFQAIWIIVLYVLTILVWKAGQKRLEAVGI